MAGFPEVSFETRVAGTSFRPEFMDAFYEANDVDLRREPCNPHDPNAIAVIHEDTGEQVGFIPREIAKVLAVVMDAGYDVTGSIKHTTGGYGNNPNRGVVVEILIEGALMEALIQDES